MPAEPALGERKTPLLRWGHATAGYVTLLVLFGTFGIAVQLKNVLAGLWLTELLSIALPAILFLQAANVRIPSYLALRAPTLPMVGLAVLLGLLNQPVVSLLEQAAHSWLPARLVADFDAKNTFLESIFQAHKWGMLAAVTIAAPLCEELFLRGFLFKAYARSMPALAAAVLTGALFSFIHMDPVGFVGLWEIGFLLAVMRHKSGSLWTAILLHAVNNGAAGAAFLFGFQDANVPPPTWFLALGGLLLIAGLFWSVGVLQAPGTAEPERAARAGERQDEFRLLRAWPVALVLLGTLGYAGSRALELVRHAKP
ncbi:MAG: CPBP family intramembrane metalloprotease [Deltaproteobacteria bacterium]|nr:CPBP family intramembrane metalloprotease [Deltaproteobacteria bacterium]